MRFEAICHSFIYFATHLWLIIIIVSCCELSFFFARSWLKAKILISDFRLLPRPSHHITIMPVIQEVKNFRLSLIVSTALLLFAWKFETLLLYTMFVLPPTHSPVSFVIVTKPKRKIQKSSYDIFQKWWQFRLLCVLHDMIKQLFESWQKSTTFDILIKAHAALDVLESELLQWLTRLCSTETAAANSREEFKRNISLATFLKIKLKIQFGWINKYINYS